MKLYITKAEAKLGASAVASLDNISIQLYRPYKDIDAAQSAPEGCTPIGEPIVIDQTLIKSWVSEREFSECTHLYVIVSTNDGSVLRVRQKLVDTYLTKNSGVHYARTIGRDEFVAAQVYIPFADSPLEDWVVRVNADPRIKAEATGESGFIEPTYQALRSFALALYPSIEVVGTQAKADGTIAITTQLTLSGQPLARKGVRFIVKSALGYINRREVWTDEHGRATVFVRKLDIPQEENVQVEFGFKYYSNVCSTNV